MQTTIGQRDEASSSAQAEQSCVRDEEPSSTFVDLRPEAVAQRRQCEIANGSPRLDRLRAEAVQRMGNEDHVAPSRTGSPGRMEAELEARSGISITGEKVQMKPVQMKNLRAYPGNGLSQRNVIQRYLYIGGEKQIFEHIPTSASATVKGILTKWINLPDNMSNKRFNDWAEALAAAGQESAAPVSATSQGSAPSAATATRVASEATSSSSSAPVARQNVGPAGELLPLGMTLAGQTVDYEGVEAGQYKLFTETELQSRELTASSGLVMRNGVKANTAGADWLFVVHANRRIYMEKGEDGVVYHSSLSRGLQPIAAGEIRIADGLVLKINEKSGHYMPPRGTSELVRMLLGEIGVNITDTVAEPFTEQDKKLAPTRVSPENALALANKARDLREKQIAAEQKTNG